ncbi:MAG: hypothetical protein K5871_11075 [Lachnospiraceae bacterium]|nr:hypothetical protein [Lachnospiraceae bacterium]
MDIRKVFTYIGIIIILIVFFLLLTTMSFSESDEGYSYDDLSAGPVIENVADESEPPAELSQVTDIEIVETADAEDLTSAVSPESEPDSSVSEETVEDIPEEADSPAAQTPVYHFRNDRLLNEHYEKHGIEMGFASAAEYEAAASAVITNPASLYKTEAEDGDGVYYLEDTNEFVILSTGGYIRTYFNPSGGRAYFDRQ